MDVVAAASLPGRYDVRLNTRHSRSQTCVRLCVGGAGAGAPGRLSPEPEKGKAEGLKVCQLQNVLLTAEVVSGELELGAKSLLLHVGCVTSARDFSLSLTFSPLQNGSNFFHTWELW